MNEVRTADAGRPGLAIAAELNPLRLGDTPSGMTNPGPLFDQVNRSGFARPGERASRFERVNCANKPHMQRVRELWEGWYARYPDATGGLRTRFRGEDHNHDGAVLELFLHELFTRLDLSPEVEPRLDSGRRPDSLVSGDAGSAYVEATYLTQPLQTPKLEAAVLDAIDELVGRAPPGIGLSLGVEGKLRRAPSIAPITNAIAAWMDRLDPQTVNWQREHQQTIGVDEQYGDWRLKLRAVPRRPRGGLIVVGPSRGGPFRVEEQLLRAVEKKVKRYPDLAIPLVVAVNIPSFDAERIETEALFGSVGVRRHADPARADWGSPVQDRASNALWFDHQRERTRHARLAALLMAHDLAPWTVANVSARLYLNPYTDDRLPHELHSLGYAVASGAELKRHRGRRSVREVLELPHDWPGFGDGNGDGHG